GGRGALRGGRRLPVAARRRRRALAVARGVEQQAYLCLAHPVAELPLEVRRRPGGGRGRVPGGLVGLESDERILRLYRVARLDEHLDDGDVLEVADVGDLDLDRAHRALRASDGPGRRTIRVDAVLLDRLGDLLCGHRAVVGERFQRGDGDVEPIDLEEATQLLAGIGAAESVGAEDDVPARHVGADLVREGTYVVGRGDDRTFHLPEQALDVRALRRLRRMEKVEARGRARLAAELGEARARPEIRLDAEVVAQQIRRRDHLAEDGAAAE